MVARVALTAVILIACLVGISLTAYAWFSVSVISNQTTLAAAKFDLDVSVTIIQGDAVKEPNAEGIYSLPAGTYSVSLTKSGSASTGFCILEADFGTRKVVCHTWQIGEGGTGPLQFTLTLNEAAAVEFIPHWGTSSFYGYENADNNPLYIRHQANVTITADMATQPKQDTTEPTTQLSETTAPTETTVPPTSEPAYLVYTVLEGDTLWDIAAAHNTSVDAIVMLNKIENSSVITIGQALKIPVSAGTQPTETTAPTETTVPTETTAPAEQTQPE